MPRNRNQSRRVILTASQAARLDVALPNWRERIGWSPKGSGQRHAGRAAATGKGFADLDGEPTYFVNFDGACVPNPGGRPTYAWVITTPDSEEVKAGDGEADTIYPRTNKTAEFSGMLAAIHAGICHAKGGAVLIRGDSELAINAMRKGWNMTKSPHLAELAGKCRAVAAAYPGRIGFEWVPRERNARVDKLAEAASV